MAHFEVGKKVICIQNHPTKRYVRGQVFELLAIRKSQCKCGGVELDIGLKIPRGRNRNYQHCAKCNNNSIKTDGRIWCDGSRFDPYDDSLSETTVDELLESLETHEPCSA